MFIKKIPFLLLTLLSITFSASAHDFEVDGIYYNIISNHATVTYKGSSYNSYNNEYTGAVNIPSTVTYNGTTYSVTSIDGHAFRNCTSLTSVTIPNSVTSIGNYTFSGCSGLTSVTIPNSVTFIGGSAFYGCSGLTSVTIPNSVTSIYSYTFYGCSGLTSVTIPNSLTWIAGNTFENCTGLTSVTIPNSVTSIGRDAFRNCTGLTSVTIPNTVTKIGMSAFFGCSGLTSVTIPNSVTSIGSYAFNGTAWYNNQPDGLVYAGMVAYKYKGTMPNGTSIILKDGCTGIAGHCFYNCSDLTSVTIGNSVTSIGEYAFISCSGLTSVTIGNSVTEIGDEAFYGCEDLTNIYSHIINPHKVSLGYAPFYGINKSNCVLIVPAASVNLYKEAPQWKDFINIRTFVSSVSLNNTQINVVKEQSATLIATILPNDAYNKNLTWNSSNPSVATVNQSGLVTANALGTATITATTTDGTNLTASCEVHVYNRATSISLNKSQTTIKVGENETLVATISPDNTLAHQFPIQWTSSNSSVATVDATGKVTARSNGTADIIASTTDGSNLSAICHVTVITLAESISLDRSQIIMYKNYFDALTATILPETTSNKNVSWTSSNSSIVSVDNAGNINAKAVGIATITATTTDGTNLSASCEVEVIPQCDLYPTTTELTHVRGQSNFSAVIPFWLSNKTAISGLQFDITLPTGMSFATVDDYPDVWLDATRKARNHSVDVNLISGSRYRVLVSSPTNNTFKGNEGEVLYMRVNIDKVHPIGSYYINTSNVIMVEPDETQHTGYNKSILVKYQYLLGDADGDATVDVADYTVTALYILSRPVETFYYEAANVSGDNGINVTDLVGITNISLGIRPHEYRPAPAIMMENDMQESMPSLNASIEGDNIVALSIDNDTPLAGMQLDLQLPQGMTLANATLEGRAAKYQLATSNLPDGNVRLLISSFGDKDIEAGNDAVIKLVLEGDNINNEMLYITGAQAASRDLRSYELNDLTLPVGTTSIDDIGYSYDKLSIYGKGNTIVVNSPSAMLIQVVHVNGMVMPVEIKPGHNTIEVGGHGVYIIKAGNSAYKVRL